MALWMLYAVVTSGLILAAAESVDRVSAGRRRWLWASALALAALVPALLPDLRRALLAPAGFDVTFGPAIPVVGSTLADLAAPAASAMSGWGVPALLSGLWLGASLSVLVVALLAIRRLQIMRRSWRRAVVDGTPVLVSPGVGPAVVGVLSPEIVLPEWALRLPAEERSLVLAHEDEHRKRRDPVVLAVAGMLPMLMPWNPALWWGFARLRDAVESDCDQRVLARRLSGAPSYARLLVDVGARTLGQVPVGAGFGERRSSLERRVRLMLDPSRRRWSSVGLRMTMAIGLFAAACSLEVNVNLGHDQSDEAVEPDAPAVHTSRGQEIALSPTFTPFTVAPSIQNRREVIQAMAREYPPMLRDAGIGGMVKVFFFIDEEGVAQDVRIDASSGNAAVDRAALAVADVYEFSPALNRDQRVPVWVSFPITFRMAEGGGGG